MSWSSEAQTSEVRPHVFTQLTVADGARGMGDEQVAPAPPSSEPLPAAPVVDVEAITAAAREEGFREGHAAGHAAGLEAGREEGHEAGYAEGLARAEEEQAATTGRLAALAERALVEAEQFAMAVEAQVVELSLAVAEKIVEREVTIDPSIVADVIRAALEEVRDATNVDVLVNPDDYAILEGRWEEALPRPLARRCELVADERVEAGGCLLETRTGQVDAQLKTKLAQVAKVFQATLEGEPA